jgi:HAD superfamily phosphoserine phosphatase-like hydrolase
VTSHVRGIVVFDLDGTLLRGSTVCELIAESLGRDVEMRRFETLSSEHEIAKSRVEMATWYNGKTFNELCTALEGANWRDGVPEAMQLLRASGIEVAIASITWRFAVEWIAQKLGVWRILGTELGQDGSIRHVWPRDKGEYLRSLAAGLGIERKRTAAVGDSINDQHMLSEASLGFFVGTGSPPPVPDLKHRPTGDILGIAREIADAWKH